MHRFGDCHSSRSVIDRVLAPPHRKSNQQLRIILTRELHGIHYIFWAISEFPKWRKYLISLPFLDKSSVRPVQVGGFEANIVVHRSTAVRGRGGPPPPWESSCRTRTGPVEADGTVDAQNAPTAPWTTLRVFHELPQGLSHRITHVKPRKAPKWRWETRIDPFFGVPTVITSDVKGERCQCSAGGHSRRRLQPVGRCSMEKHNNAE